MKFKNPKMKYLVITIVILVCVAIGVGCYFYIGNNEEYTGDYKVLQDDGSYCLCGGYIILKTEDKCDYLEMPSKQTYDAYTYIQDRTTKTLYVFVAGKTENMKFGSNEEELKSQIEERFGKSPVKGDSEKIGKYKWNKMTVTDYKDYKEDVCDIDFYYIFKKDLIYLVQVYTDEESNKKETLLDEIELKDKPIKEFKNESPIKIAEDGTGYITKEQEGTEYEMHVPSVVAEDYHYTEMPEYMMFQNDASSFATCRVTKEKEKIEGSLAEMNDELVGSEYESIFKEIKYSSFETEDGRNIEYEYSYLRDGEIWIKAQVSQDDAYYILDINSVEDIEDIESYLSDYYFK